VLVGLGQLGLAVVERLRDHLHTQAAPLALLPNLRFLVLDTDPDALRNATRTSSGAAAGRARFSPGGAPPLSAGEVLLTALNRPSYYLKPATGKLPVQTWLNPRILYRIPRSQVTTGVRALGRLAFCDNYRAVLRRLQLELETCLDPSTLQAAARQTGLGLRTNRPRVYIVTSLAGGTGSGMFLDLAYNVRALLGQLGYDPPDVVGLLLLPSTDASARTRTMPLGNAYAALAELQHFGRPDTLFTALYHEREAPVEDANPPFSRCVLMPLPDESDEVAQQEVVDQCAQGLYLELVTSLGREADLGRAGLPSPPWGARGQYFHTFGLFQLAWPRHALLQAASVRLCRQLVQRWLSKDARPLRDSVQQWIGERWSALELGETHFIDRLQGELARQVGQPVELAVKEVLSPLVEAMSTGGPGLRPPEPAELAGTLAALEELVGTPGSESRGSGVRPALTSDSGAQPPSLDGGRLLGLLKEAARSLVGEWAQKLAELPVQLIEEPGFRLAGAEEAIRLLVATIEQALEHQDPLRKDLARQAAEAYQRLCRFSESDAPAGRDSGARSRQGKGRSGGPAAEVLQLLHDYPKWRLQGLVLEHVAAAFLSLRGHLSDELREVNFCRTRLTELQRRLSETVEPGMEGVEWKPGSSHSASLPSVPARREAGARDEERAGLGRRLFVAGCGNLFEAVEQFLAEITPEHLLDLDLKVQEMLNARFTALVHVCLTRDNILEPLQEALLQQAQDYAAGLLPPTSVAELFFEQTPDEEAAEAGICQFYTEAAPEICPPRASQAAGLPAAELCLLATPPGPASERFAALLRQAMPQVEVHHSVGSEDILIYRERNNLSLSELEQFGPRAYEAYTQMLATADFTPHSRGDVVFRPR
jgi:hypothetical protein